MKQQEKDYFTPAIDNLPFNAMGEYQLKKIITDNSQA